MHFLKNVFITLLFVATTSTSHQLHAMEEEMTAMLEKPVASDLQIYQLLSAITKDNPQLCLPHEVTQIITLNACEITEEERCYEKYRKCLFSPGTVLNFIEDSLNKSMSHTYIVNILKTCLRYSRKSLSEIKSDEGHTVLHHMSHIKNILLHLDCVKIILRVVGDKAWHLIKMQDSYGYTVLHDSVHLSVTSINEILSAAHCCPEELWEFICKRINSGHTALHLLAIKPFAAETIKALLSFVSCPEKAWSLINERNPNGKTALSFAMEYNENKEVTEILESYRPKEQ